MWSGLGTLLLLSVSLAVSSLLAGSLPLIFNLSRRHMRLLTACGTGILVGTALIVIIPEGVETLYSAASNGASTSHQLQTRGRLDPAFVPTEAWLGRRSHLREVHPSLSEDQLDSILVSRVEEMAGTTLSGPDDSKPGSGITKSPKSAVIGRDEHDFEPHAWVGISIITGFILMYLIDQLPKLATARTKLKPAYISLGRMGLRRGSTPDDESEPSATDTHNGETFQPSSTTTGLVIHAVADGIALGASSASASQRLSMIIFLALMIHKAPAAFGLTAVLLKQGLSKRGARAHLVVFSLAAPVGALATWFVANIIGGHALDAGSRTTFITALLLLFSGGTFLYVAMHTMQGSGHDHSAENTGGENGYADIYQQQAAKKADDPTLVDTMATVAGMLLPLLTQVGHAH
ncbi:hypothetical protein ANO11243_052840 [Dothideomycetidae sp. 11243]|nr:hypothetical protein ANO11243_052840 [fungal sp. No.11243]